MKGQIGSIMDQKFVVVIARTRSLFRGIGPGETQHGRHSKSREENAEHFIPTRT